MPESNRLTYFWMIFSLFIFSFPSLANAQFYTVSGEILFEKKGTIFLALVDRNSFIKPEEAGLLQIFYPDRMVSPDSDQQAKREKDDLPPTKSLIPFTFPQVSPGTYAIVAFQDANGNGKLDTGLLGPKEPWGMSFRAARPAFRPPRFEDASFTVPEEIRFFRIELWK